MAMARIIGVPAFGAAIVFFIIAFGVGFQTTMSGVKYVEKEVQVEVTKSCLLDIGSIHTLGSITALIPEASDAGTNQSYLIDGESGDVDFPFGDFKVLATVGEYLGDVSLVGVPDGMGAYLHDVDTVRVIVQSESYGPASAFESYPYAVNDGALFTGSHIQYVDYDRSKLADFMNNDDAASTMVKDFAELVTVAYNLKGEKVGKRNGEEATPVGAHFGNTDPEGNWVTTSYNVDDQTTPVFPSRADWTLMSLCSAHLEEKHQWGANLGVEDLLFITNEEWSLVKTDVESYVGLSAHVVDIEANTMYAVGVFTMGGFEKIVEIKTPSPDYVAFAVSGYNGAFGEYEKIVEKRNDEAKFGKRADGKPWVKPQNIVPTRVYIGKKGFNEKGEAATDFLSRNGLRYGRLYGFAVDEADITVNDEVVWRDAWHKNEDRKKGDKVNGRFYPIEWTWNGEVKSFEYDGSWDFQDKPKNGADGFHFWTGAGPDASGAKTEHISPTLDGRSAYIQTSTAGYFGEYNLDLESALDALAGKDFPDMIGSEYYMFQGETSVKDLIDLGGKGVRADGKLNNMMYDKTDKETFEDIDGFDLIEAAEGSFGIIFEDGKNIFGERSFIVNLDKTEGVDLSYKFMAQSGGNNNTRAVKGVSVPRNTWTKATGHEFSGTIDLSGMLVKNNGTFVLTPGASGEAKRAAEKTVSIDDKLIVAGLQAHTYSNGVIEAFGADRGGQWLLYRPKLL